MESHHQGRPGPRSELRLAPRISLLLRVPNLIRGIRSSSSRMWSRCLCACSSLGILISWRGRWVLFIRRVSRFSPPSILFRIPSSKCPRRPNSLLWFPLIPGGADTTYLTKQGTLLPSHARFYYRPSPDTFLHCWLRPRPDASVRMDKISLETVISPLGRAQTCALQGIPSRPTSTKKLHCTRGPILCSFPPLT